MKRDIEYEETNQINIDEIKCKNYVVCETTLPEWWFECKGNYLCTGCHMSFGTWGDKHTGKGILPLTGIQECPICFEDAETISQPNCDHSICIKCFKRCYFGDKTNEPKFPYNEKIENEYWDDPENEKWKDYPQIKTFNKEYDDWLIQHDKNNEKEKNLHLCPLCRK